MTQPDQSGSKMFKVFVGTITVWKSLYAQKSNLGYIAIGLVLSGCISGDFDKSIAGPEVAAEIRKTSQWANYAGSGSRRATKLEQINKDNVADLEVAWTFRTGDLNSVFQSTPILGQRPTGAVYTAQPGHCPGPANGGRVLAFRP